MLSGRSVAPVWGLWVSWRRFNMCVTSFPHGQCAVRYLKPPSKRLEKAPNTHLRRQTLCALVSGKESSVATLASVIDSSGSGGLCIVVSDQSAEKSAVGEERWLLQ